MTLAQSPEPVSGDQPQSESPVGRRGVIIAMVVLAAFIAIPPVFRFAGRVGLALFILVLTAALSLVWINSKDRSGSPLVLPAWLTLIGLAVPIASAVSPRFALESAIVPLSAVGLLLFLSSGIISRQELLVGIAIAGGVMGLIAVFGFILRTFDWIAVMSAATPGVGIGGLLPVSPPRATISPYLHPNETAPILTVGICASVAVARISGIRRLSWITGLAAAVALVLTGSRGGLVGALVGLGVTWILLADGSKSQRQRRTRVLLAGLVLGVGGLAGLWVMGVRPDFIFRSTFFDRLPVMRLGLEMAESSPWVGHGPGAFPYLFPLYGPELYPGTEARAVWVHAHNAYVQALLEFGLIGTALVLAGIGLALVRSFRSARTGGLYARIGTAAAVGAMAAFALHSTIDSLYTRLATVGFLVAILASGVEPLAAPNRSQGRWATHLAPMLSIPILVLTTMGAHSDYLQGRTEVVREDFASASAAFAHSLEADRLPVYLQVLNYAQSKAGEEPEDPQDEALAPFLTGSVPLNLAMVALDVGAFEMAKGHLEDAYPLIRGDEAALVEYGFLSMEVGAPDQATIAFSEAVGINPWLSTSPFLDVLPSEMRRRVLDTAFDKQPCWFGDEWILNGATTDDQVAFIEDECPPEEPPSLMAMVMTGEASEALAAANDALASTPDVVDLRRVAGVAAFEAGLVEEARHHFAIAALLGDPSSAFLLESTFDGSEIPQPITELAKRLSHGYSPVLLDRTPTPLYLMGIRILGTGASREGLPSVLAGRHWELAYTSLHQKMIDDLEPAH